MPDLDDTTDSAPPAAEVIGDSWRLPPRLGLAAWVIVVALVAGGWLVHWWGPINPGISGYLHTSTVEPTPTAPTTAMLRVANDSQSELTIERLTVAESSSAASPQVFEASPARALPVMLDSGGGESWTTTDPAATPLPVTLGPGEAVVVTTELAIDNCPTPGQSISTAMTATLEIRSSWGRTTSHDFTGTSSPGIRCPPSLPVELSPPADRAAAAEEVSAAFGIAYDANLPADLRLSRIDDPTGVADASAAAKSGAYGGLTGTVRAEVLGVSFDRPGHATVGYLLTAAGVGPRTGEAVLVDGAWKVTRSTVCADLALAGVECAPLPR